MSWKGFTVMDQRVRFISEYLNGYYPLSEICSQFEISRKTGYKWIRRYEKFGSSGLEDRSRKPYNSPHKTDGKIINAIREVRQKHPYWGPKKLLAILKSRHRGWRLPAISTTADILKREGLIEPGRRRIRRKHPGCPKTTASNPNDIWTADYKGHFKMRNGQYCYPLTVCDMHSRFLLGCEAHKAISVKESRRYFFKLFKKYGLPEEYEPIMGSLLHQALLQGYPVYPYGGLSWEFTLNR